MKRVINTIREAKNELRKVTWPTKEQTTRLTTVVIGVSIFAGVYLGVVDYIFDELMQIIIS